jgi:hypothetical protein
MNMTTAPIIIDAPTPEPTAYFDIITFGEAANQFGTLDASSNDFAQGITTLLSVLNNWEDLKAAKVVFIREYLRGRYSEEAANQFEAAPQTFKKSETSGLYKAAENRWTYIVGQTIKNGWVKPVAPNSVTKTPEAKAARRPSSGVTTVYDGAGIDAEDGLMRDLIQKLAKNPDLRVAMVYALSNASGFIAWSKGLTVKNTPFSRVTAAIEDMDVVEID